MHFCERDLHYPHPLVFYYTIPAPPAQAAAQKKSPGALTREYGYDIKIMKQQA
jgi:hypothetical protein